MSATYNWAYKPGVANKYGFAIPNSADNVKAANFCYVAMSGNDITGNGSRQLPFRTLTKAQSLTSQGGVIIVGSGVYREQIPYFNNLNKSWIGDGDVVFDSSFHGFFQTDNGDNSFYNITHRGAGGYVQQPGTRTTLVYDCIFDNIAIYQGYTTIIANSIFLNCNVPINLESGNLTLSNCTFYKCISVSFGNTLQTAFSNLFYQCNISANNLTNMDLLRYSLFYQCNFKMTAGISSTGGALYPSVPSGFTYFSNIASLVSTLNSLSIFNTFNGSAMGDPLFNNAAIGDLSLNFASPAKNLSYFGTYVGAKSIAYPIKARATESVGAFEFASAINITVADDSITLTNPVLDAQIDTNVIVNTLGRELANFPSYGFNADRNGQYIDSIADLDATTKSTSDALTVGMPYIVEVGAIVYNGATYQPGQRFTTVTGQTSFTSFASGVVREILEAPQRHTIMARFSDGGANITPGMALTVGNYYYIVSGSITYNAVNYNAGDVFKAIDTNAFSGSDMVIVAFSNESYQHYEPGIRPTSNNTGDLRTGSIIRGNGDPAYVRGGIGIQEFPINAKFIQIRYIIRFNNLKP